MTAYFDSYAIFPRYSPKRRLGNRAEGGLGRSGNWTRTLASTSARYTSSLATYKKYSPNNYWKEGKLPTTTN